MVIPLVNAPPITPNAVFNHAIFNKEEVKARDLPVTVVPRTGKSQKSKNHLKKEEQSYSSKLSSETSLSAQLIAQSEEI